MGIRKKEKNSLIRLLIKAILPSSAPPRRLMVTPARLYQPIPLATAAPSAGEIPQDHCADQPSDDRAHCNAKGDNKDFQMILADFFEDAVVHSDADSHRKHQYV